MRKPIPFGKYLLLERVNVGGMAEVFLAKAFGLEGFEQLLAIKRILPSMVEDHEFIKMFLDEARISVQLNHPNIIRISELGARDESYYIAMEYVSGKDLRHLLEYHRKRKQCMPTALAVYIAGKMCEGLEYAHRKKDARGGELNIVHRDVSPQNILISYDADVKIIDFGIAKAANRAQKTEAGILKGKFGYMSPEQVRGLPIDRRSDIFALGVILYEMLTGERLFVGESDFSTLEKVRSADVLPPSQFNKDIPPALEKVVLKALAREQADRYQWCSELQQDLLKFLLKDDLVFTSTQLAQFMRETFIDDRIREEERMARFAIVAKPSDVELVGVMTGSAMRTKSGEIIITAPSGDEADDDEGTAIAEPGEVPGDGSEEEDLDGKTVVDARPSVEDPEATAADRGPERGAEGEEDESELTETQSVRPPGGNGAGSAPEHATFIDPALEPGLRRDDGDEHEDSVTHDVEGPKQPGGAETVIGPIPEKYHAAHGAEPATAPTGIRAMRPARGRIGLLAGLAGAGVALLVVIGTYLFATGGGPKNAELIVTVVPFEGSELRIDGRKVKSGTTMALPGGDHEVWARAPGYKPVNQRLHVPAGTKLSQEIRLVPERPTGPLPEAGPSPAASPPTSTQSSVASEGPLPAPATPPQNSSAVTAAPRAGPAAPDAPEPKRVALLIESVPDGAEVELDGQRVGRTPYAGDFEAGSTSTARVSQKGYKTETLTVAWDGRSPKIVRTARLEALPKAKESSPPQPPKPANPPKPPPVKKAVVEKGPKGKLITNSTPIAKIFVDGRDTGRWTPVPPAKPLELSAGQHTITYRAADQKEARRQVTIVADQMEKVVGVDDFK